MSDLKSDIWNEVVKAIRDRPELGHCSEEMRCAIEDSRAAEAMDNIITMFRERMLSEDAMESLALIEVSVDEHRAISKNMNRGVFAMNTDNPICKMDLRGAYRASMSRVLDVALGAEVRDGGA